MIIRNKPHCSKFKALPDFLTSYFENKFLLTEKKNFNKILSKNKEYVSFWHDKRTSWGEPLKAWTFLKTCFPQLNFPIQEEIHKDISYRSSTLRGDFTQIKIFENRIGLFSNSISVDIYNSFAGQVLVLKVNSDSDFIKIIQSLLHQNKPKNIPDSMGAVFINGINNWQKIKGLKSCFLKNNPTHQWKSYFENNVRPFSYLYKDRIIVLSNKYYSNVRPEVIGIDPEEWQELSLQIRLMHECTHLYTKQRYGIASNNLHDELIADYIGLLCAAGTYDKNWMLLFMGLEDYPNYRIGSRLQNYIEDSKIDSEVFKVLTECIYKCISNIALFEQDLKIPISPETLRLRIETLCETGLEDMASSTGAKVLNLNYTLISQSQ